MLPHLNSWIRIDGWKDFLKPAVKENACEVDHSVLNSRIYKLAIMTLIALGVAVLLTPIFPEGALIVVPLALTGGLLGIFETWRAENAADKKAVDEYLDKNIPFPSTSATYRITRRIKAAQLLISASKKSNETTLVLNKINEKGQKLVNLFYIFESDLEVYKLFVSNGFDLKAQDELEYPLFQKVVEHDKPEFLEYVLENQIIQPSDFDNDQQVEFWLYLGTIQTGRLLKKHGFNVNIQNSKGYTPLNKLLHQYSIFPLRFDKLEIVPHVTALLNCGADPSLTVSINGQNKNAFELNKNPEINVILDQYKANRQ